MLLLLLPMLTSPWILWIPWILQSITIDWDPVILHGCRLRSEGLESKESDESTIKLRTLGESRAINKLLCFWVRIPIKLYFLDLWDSDPFFGFGLQGFQCHCQ